MARLLELAGFDEIYSFLLEEKLATEEDIKAVTQASYKPKALVLLLTSLTTRNLIQLLEYEWQVLPVERIKLTIVTDRAQRTLGFNF